MPQSRKRVKQTIARRERNKHQRTLVRTKIKQVRKAIANNDAAAAQAAFADAKPIIDRMAGKGQIHKNKAARHKSRLNAQIRAIS